MKSLLNCRTYQQNKPFYGRRSTQQVANKNSKILSSCDAKAKINNTTSKKEKTCIQIENTTYSLSELNKRTIESGILLTKQRSRHAMNSTLVISKTENVECFHDEFSQKPATFIIPSINEAKINSKDEDVAVSPRAERSKRIHANVVNDSGTRFKKIEILKDAQKSIQGKYNKEKIKIPSKYKQGYLEKKSKGILTPWKKKVCTLCEMELCIYMGLDKNRISAVIDFRRVPAKILVEGNSCIFM